MFPWQPRFRIAPVSRPTPTSADPASHVAHPEVGREPLGAALIGYGAWGENLARNIGRLQACRLAALSDSSRARLERARSDHPHAAPVPDWKDVLDDRSIGAVFVATPADTHFDIALAALQAGKHVFVEKPMSGSAAEARRLVDEAAWRRRVLMVDHTYVFSPPVRAIALAMSAGAIGRPCRYESQRKNASAPRTDTSVHRDLAVHDLAILGHLVADEPRSVSAARLDADVGGNASAVRLELAWSGGFTAAIEVAWSAPAKVRQVTIDGTAGRIDYADLETERPVRVRAHGGDVAPVLDPVEPLFEAVRHFVTCIEGHPRPLADGSAGLRVVRILDAADRSLALGGRAIEMESEAAAA